MFECLSCCLPQMQVAPPACSPAKEPLTRALSFDELSHAVEEFFEEPGSLTIRYANGHSLQIGYYKKSCNASSSATQFTLISEHETSRFINFFLDSKNSASVSGPGVRCSFVGEVNWKATKLQDGTLALIAQPSKTTAVFKRTLRDEDSPLPSVSGSTYGSITPSPSRMSRRSIDG